MQNILATLLSTSASDLKASGTGKAAAPCPKGVESFFALLNLATGGAASQGTSKGGQQKESNASTDSLGGFSAALAASDTRGILQALKENVGTSGAVENTGYCPAEGKGSAMEDTKSLPSDSSANGAGALESDSTQEQTVEKLLLALVAKVAVKGEAIDPSTSGRGAVGLNAAGPQGIGEGAASQGTAESATPNTDGVASSDASSTGGADVSRDQETLQLLALLVYYGVQAVFQEQNQAAQPAVGTNGAFSEDAVPTSDAKVVQDGTQQTKGAVDKAPPDGGQAIPGDTSEFQTIIDKTAIDIDDPQNRMPLGGEAGIGKAILSSIVPGGETGAVENIPRELSRHAAKTASTTEVPVKEEAGGSAKDTSGAGKSPSVAAAGDASPSRVSIGSGSLLPEDRTTSDLSLLIKGVQGATQARPMNGTGETGAQSVAWGGQQGEKKDASGITAIIHDLSPLLEGRGDSAPQDNTQDKGQPSGQQNYQFAGESGAGVAGGISQEENGKVAERPAANTAVERFQQVFEQVSGKTGQHGLTVKLDIGSEGSVVLGMKDLGQTVSVEVKASQDGIVSLLQSQKDTIVRHLEGKDVHAQIVIDPNASGTPEKRERKETGKQRTFRPAQAADAGFGEFLEVFA